MVIGHLLEPHEVQRTRLHPSAYPVKELQNEIFETGRRLANNVLLFGKFVVVARLRRVDERYHVDEVHDEVEGDVRLAYVVGVDAGQEFHE